MCVNPTCLVCKFYLRPVFVPRQPSQSQKEKVLAAKESLIFVYFTSISTS